MTYELWAIEVSTGDGPALWRRIAEDGEGSPLTWDTRDGAEDMIAAQGPAAAAVLRPVRLAGSPAPAPDRTSPFELVSRFLHGPDGS